MFYQDIAKLLYTNGSDLVHGEHYVFQDIWVPPKNSSHTSLIDIPSNLLYCMSTSPSNLRIITDTGLHLDYDETNNLHHKIMILSNL